MITTRLLVQWRRFSAIEGLGWRVQCLIFLIAAALVVTRRPDALLNPQFYAEDGAVWYANAYNIGWFHALAFPEGGYLNTLQRLVASIALLVPLRCAPLLMNLFGIALQVLPVTLLLSARCAGWGSLPVRVLQAAAYIAVPNSDELNVNITNSQFHLALLACLLAFARPPATVRGRVFDLAVLVVMAVSGPFCFVLLPLELFFWWKRRHRWYLGLAAIVAVGTAIQFWELARTAATSRPQRVLGATPKLFLQLLVGEIYLADLLGRNGAPSRSHLPGLIIVAALGTCVVVYCLVKARWELRLFIVFSAVLFVAALERPLLSGSIPAWQAIVGVVGMRYWFFPILAFSWSLIWCASESRSKIVRILCTCALLLSIKGAARDWEHPAYTDMHFPKYAKKFEMAPAGTRISIPIFPSFEPMELLKKGYPAHRNTS